MKSAGDLCCHVMNIVFVVVIVNFVVREFRRAGDGEKCLLQLR